MKTRSEKMRERALDIGYRTARTTEDFDEFGEAMEAWEDGSGSIEQRVAAMAERVASDLLSGNKDWILDTLEDIMEMADPSQDCHKQAKRLIGEVKRFRRRRKDEKRREERDQDENTQQEREEEREGAGSGLEARPDDLR